MNSYTLATEACAYCGLPLPQPRRRTATARYCCFGCRFAADVTGSRGEEGDATWALAKLGLAIFFTMNVLVFTMVLWSADVYAPDPDSQAATALSGLFRYLCMLFALPVLLLLGGPLWDNSWRNLREGRLGTDLLLFLGVVASYLYSVQSVFFDAGPVYFEVGCIVLLLVTLGRWLEATGKLRTGAAIESLARLLPDSARVVLADREEMIPLKQVSPGTKLRVLPGERIPCDGRILRGSAMVDAQVLTGESGDLVKDSGDRVLGGMLNLDGDLLLETTSVGGGGALERLIELVREARRSKGRYERIADRVAAWFLPIVAVAAIAAMVYHGQRYGLERGILVSLSVVLIACPCALGLATPMAVWTALGEAARAQVLFVSGEALERLAKVKVVLFDKTGTLTTGTPRLGDYALDDATPRVEILRRTAALAASSTHEYSRAIRQWLVNEGIAIEPEAGEPPRTIAGRGVFSRHGSLGSYRWMLEVGVALPAAMGKAIEGALISGQPLVCVAWDGRVRGVFRFLEETRPEAFEAIARLRNQGQTMTLLTGDHSRRATILGRELGIDVEAELLPEDKVAAVARFRQFHGPTAMVGDGLNDAPALARSDVGIAMGCGADVSRESASVCLLGNDLLRVPWAIELSKRTIRVIQQNLFWAFVYNSLGIAIACAGYLSPIVAALAMVLSSSMVVMNSLRLGRLHGPSSRSEFEPNSTAPEDRSGRRNLPRALLEVRNT